MLAAMMVPREVSEAKEMAIITNRTERQVNFNAGQG